jgi:adenylate cyclase class 1
VLTKTLLQNKRIFRQYNEFRKQIFAELSPKDSEVILHLLPWLLSINDPSCPGYVERLRQPFRVYSIDQDREILKREAVFKNLFNIRNEGPLLRHVTNACIIQGIYTIGSVGTISQTSQSDCDIWICINREDFDDTALRHLSQKVNLIKDWMDSTVKISVFFFISDIQDIRNCHFGSIDYESSGSAQRNVLREEFYRTCILIYGKIPFWWVCFDRKKSLDYEEAWLEATRNDEGYSDYVDLGNLQSVDRQEYFGAALWQFNKSLTHPLKSIIKMLLLKMLLESPSDELLCHRFRRTILGEEKTTDPSIFTMDAVFDYYEKLDFDTFDFIRKCFYLRYEIKLMSKKMTLKESLSAELFKRYKMNRHDLYHLNEFASWNLQEQIAFGNRIFNLLLEIYKDIDDIRMGIPGNIQPQDLTILGRKLASCLSQKDYKVPIIHKVIESQHRQTLILALKGKTWQVTPANDSAMMIAVSKNLIYCLTYLVWNDMYLPGLIRMMPNPTPVTIQETTNLSGKIKELFGINDVTAIDFNNFLDEESITRMLVVVSFEQESTSKDMNDLCVIFKNNWGELFIRRFNGIDTFKAFLGKICRQGSNPEISYYIQRNSLYYEKIIERTKRIVSEMLTG